MKKILFVIFFFIHANGYSYPISPLPLRALVKESPYILNGYVSDVHPHKNKKGHVDYNIATIVIKEQLKGTIKGRTIQLKFNPHIVCPSPAVYFKDTHVLLFLAQDNGKYHAYGESYGVKTLQQKDIEIYRQRISELQAINKLTDQQEQTTQTVEWLVKCAEHPVTSWDGCYELSPDTDFSTFCLQPDTMNYTTLLSPAQKERLKQALLSSGQDPKYFNINLAGVVSKYDNAAAEDIMIERLKTRKDHQIIVDELIKRLKHRNASSEMDLLLANYNKIKYDSRKEADKRKLIDEFLKMVTGND